MCIYSPVRSVIMMHEFTVLQVISTYSHFPDVQSPLLSMLKLEKMVAELWAGLGMLLWKGACNLKLSRERTAGARAACVFSCDHASFASLCMLAIQWHFLGCSSCMWELQALSLAAECKQEGAGLCEVTLGFHQFNQEENFACCVLFPITTLLGSDSI